MEKAEAIVARLLALEERERLALSRLREEGFRWRDLAPALRAAGALGLEEEDLPLLAALGALAGTFRHREGLHPARALAEGLRPEGSPRLRAILEARTGVEMAWTLLRLRGPVEELDLLEVARTAGNWPQRRKAWAEMAGEGA